MKILTIYSIGDFYRNNKLQLVKLFKETIPGIGLKQAKDIVDDLFFNSFEGIPFQIELYNIDENDFASGTHPTLVYTIGNNVIPNVKENPCKVTDNFAVALDTIRKGLYESHKLRQEIDQLKQINHELTKEIRSLKSTLYTTAVDLNKQYQATNELINRSGPRASHIIKDLANDIRENCDTSEATKDC